MFYALFDAFTHVFVPPSVYSFHFASKATSFFL